MQLTWLLALATTCSTVLAVPQDGQSDGNSDVASSTQCYTTRVSTAVRQRQTFWSTMITTSATTSTSIVTSIIVPYRVTTTIMRRFTTTKTAPANVRTATTSSTTIITSGSTITSTFSTSVITSTSSVVLNVSTSAGFLPVQSTLPGASLVAINQAAIKRHEPQSPNNGRNSGQRTPSYFNFVRSRFQGDVTCYVYQARVNAVTTIRTVTSTASSLTLSVTVSTTVTSTQVPQASTTITRLFSTTTNIYKTSSVTATSTEIETTATSTTYAACATNNQANAINVNNAANGILGVSEGLGGYVSISEGSAYDCCVTAIDNPRGEHYFFGTDGTCWILESTTCASPEAASARTVIYSNVNPQFTVGNANCGQLTRSSALLLAETP